MDNTKNVSWTDIARMIPKRPADGHKGTFGKLLVIGGSHGMAGAAYFAAEAAYRMGCGMVRIATPEENRIIYQIKLPEALLSTYDSHYEEVVFDAIRWADAIVLGPGMSMEKTQKDVFWYAYEKAVEAGLPMLIDADGLNILSKETGRLKEDHPPIILTPHLMEMSRLTGLSVDEIAGNMANIAKEYADKWKVVIHLKSAKSFTACFNSDDVFSTTAGNDGMATAGSGDVLSGIMGGLLVQGVDVFVSAIFGAYIHGLCGDAAAEQLGHESMLASDMITAIQRVLRGMHL